MSLSEKLNEAVRLIRLRRQAMFDEAGITDPMLHRDAAIAWALLKDRMAHKCVRAVAAGDLAGAQTSARRYEAADRRAQAATAAADRCEDEISAYIAAHRESDEDRA